MPKLKTRYIVLIVFIALVTLVLQFNGSLNITKFSAFPLFPLGFIVAISMFSSELRSVIIGLIMGILVDSCASSNYSFNTLVYPLIAFGVSLIAHYLFNVNVRSCLLLSLLSAILVLSLNYIVYDFSVGFNNLLVYFLRNIVPSAIITAVFSAILYFINKKIYNTPR